MPAAGAVAGLPGWMAKQPRDEREIEGVEQRAVVEHRPATHPQGVSRHLPLAIGGRHGQVTRAAPHHGPPRGDERRRERIKQRRVEPLDRRRDRRR